MSIDLSQTKKCNTCQITKTWNEFHIRSDKPRSDCKICRCTKSVLLNKKSLNGARSRLKPIKICPIVSIVRKRIGIKTWRANNKEHVLDYKKTYNKNNKKRTNDYMKIRRKNDHKFNMIQRIRDRLKHALTAKNWKKTTHFSEYIGCTREQLIHHIESQFTVGMSWDNRSKWHLDHIMPISSANTAEELYELSHFLNLKPIWVKDNIIKSDKITVAGHETLTAIRKVRGII